MVSQGQTQHGPVRELLPWLLLAAVTVAWMIDLHRWDAVAEDAGCENDVAVRMAPEASWDGFEVNHPTKQRDAAGQHAFPFAKEPTRGSGVEALSKDDGDHERRPPQEETYCMNEDQVAGSTGERNASYNLDLFVSYKRVLSIAFVPSQLSCKRVMVFSETPSDAPKG